MARIQARPASRFGSTSAYTALAALLLLLFAGQAAATGEGCGVFDACPHAHDYCRFVSIFSSICTERGDAREGCSGIGQGTCNASLVCDIIGECRHDPPQGGEPCGLLAPCAFAFVCSADIGGRCQARGQAGQGCSGIGQGSCASGLVCDANRTCRHDPPIVGEPCGIGLDCATSALYCTFPIGGVCAQRGDGGDACTGLGQGSCLAGLACDILGECRHVPSQFGERCGTGVPCVSSLGCSADIAGRCENRDISGEVCSGIGQGSCQAGLVCDANRTCRHDPPALGEPCGIGVPCVSSLGCSAEIAGRCEERDKAGETCSGVGQGSCQGGLVCDFLRTCRHDPPALDEPCGIGVPCAPGADLFCQAGTGRCRLMKSVGEGCSAFNLCRPELSCEPCFLEGCDYPLQCFPNSNDGAITEQQCLALYDPAVHQTARDLGLARTIAGGDGISAGIAESQSFGVAYEAGDRYGCFTELCVGVNLDAGISAFVSVGFYSSFDAVGGSETAFVQEVDIAEVVSFSTSQIFERRSLDPFDIGALVGTEDSLAIGLSPNPFPVSAGVYACETVLDTVIGGEGQPAAPRCGDGTANAGEGCDDGNLTSGDGCSSACTLEVVCGDGGLDPGERCDDGNTAGGDGCSTRCTLEPACADGNLDAAEGCDDGNTASGDGCSALCTIEPVCGNRLRESGEGCDDGNAANGDGCSALCAAEPPMVGDIDFDFDVDRNDVDTVYRLRNAPASSCPECDLDKSGLITVADGRALVLLCTRPRCAVE